MLVIFHCPLSTVEQPGRDLADRQRRRWLTRLTGLFHGREFYLALPPLNLINREGS